MKRKLITRWRVIAALVIVLTIAASAIYAALTITEAEITGASCQQWTLVAESLLVSGTAMDVSDGYAKTLLIEWGYVEADDSAGAQMDVEISEDGGNWILLTSFMTTVDATIGADDVNDATSLAGDAFLVLTEAVTDEFDVVNRQWIVYDNVDITTSEIVRTKSKGTTVDVDFDTITLCAVTEHAHADTTTVYDRAGTIPVHIPGTVAWVRVNCYNSDATCKIIYAARPIKITGI